MDIVIIEDLKIISKYLISDFTSTSKGQLSITVLESIEEVRNFDFSQTKFIVSDLFLDTTIYETLFELYQIKSHFDTIKISIYTQSSDIPLLEAILCTIKASNLFDKRFISSVADTVLYKPCQAFRASKSEINKANAILNMTQNNQLILENLARHVSLTTIAINFGKSKSAVSQALKKLETTLGAKRHILKMFSS